MIKLVLGLLYCIVCVILCLAVLMHYWCVADGRTDGQTHNNSIYCASIASCGKNRSHDTDHVHWG